MGIKFGYARVSSQDQNEARQLLSLERAGICPDRIYVDHQSGKDFKRPKYRKLLRGLKEGDALFLHSIDRLGRDYEEILEQWKLITKIKGADIIVLDMPLLDTRRGKDLMGTFLADIVLQVLSFVAEHERGAIRQRQAEGIEAARRNGIHMGRPEQPLPDRFREVCGLWASRQIGLTEAARMCDMARSTFHRKARGLLPEGFSLT